MKLLFTFTITFLFVLSTNVFSQGNQVKIKSGYVQSGRARLHYEEKGEGTPLIMIHGGFLNRHMWDNQFELFSKTYRTIRYDVRGHGLSRCEPDTFSNEGDLKCLIDSLHIKRAIIMGLSMGSNIAIDFSILYPDKVKALVLTSSGLTGYKFIEKQIAENNKKMEMAFEKDSLEQGVEWFLQSWYDGPKRTIKDVDTLIRNKTKQMMFETIKTWTEQGKKMNLDPPAMGRLNEIKVPTLLITGDLDQPEILKIADTIAKKAPYVLKVEMNGVAHMVNMEKPDEFNKTVQNFLSVYVSKVYNFNKNLYEIMLYSVNSLVSIGNDGVLIVDANYYEAAPMLKDEIVQLGGKEFRYIINTHWHYDHVDGNKIFGKEVVKIAHSITRQLLSEDQNLMGSVIKAHPQDSLPQITADSELTLYLNNDTIKVIALPGCHSGSDLLVYFKNANVLHVGDIVFSDVFPFYDIEHGGSVTRGIDILQKIIDLMPANVRIIPGHGREYTINDMKDYRKMFIETSEIVKKEFKKGKSLEEMRKKDILKNYKKWSKGSNPDFWIGIVYNSIKKEK